MVDGYGRKTDTHQSVGNGQATMAETLRRLLANGLIERHTYAEAPPRTDYLLTPLGKTLVDGPMKALGNWVLEHGDELLDAQDRTTPPAR